METPEKKIPSKEEVLAFYADQIEVAKVRRELAEHLYETAKFEALRAQSIAALAQLTTPQGGTQEHTISQEDIDANPELIEKGIKVGDVINIGIVQEEKNVPVITLNKE